jgi:NitT/TauT family transport system substrate-binding protein
MGQNTVAGRILMSSNRHGARLFRPDILRRCQMRYSQTSTLRNMMAPLIGLAGVLCLGAGPGRAEDAKPPLALQLTFDRPLEASMAPFVVAANRGLFAKEALNVSSNSANGSTEAIGKVAAGESEMALVDINELIRWRDKPGSPPIKAVFVLFNQAPYSFIARKSRGIRALADLAGKTVGIADSDFSFKLWPALAKQNGIKAESLKIYKMSASVREPILSAGQVDAVAGFSYLAAVNLRDRGVPASDLTVLRYNDYGCEAYGFAVVVNPAFAASKPEAVKGFVRATIAGTHAAIRDPARAVDDVVGRMEGGSRELELARLQTAISDNILTGEVRHNGLGGVDPARLERSIGQIAEDFKFHKRPSAADIFDDSFLPPVGDRLIN